jgi:hypothetical protein
VLLVDPAAVPTPAAVEHAAAAPVPGAAAARTTPPYDKTSPYEVRLLYGCHTDTTTISTLPTTSTHTTSSPTMIISRSTQRDRRVPPGNALSHQLRRLNRIYHIEHAANLSGTVPCKHQITSGVLYCAVLHCAALLGSECPYVGRSPRHSAVDSQ